MMVDIKKEIVPNETAKVIKPMTINSAKMKFGFIFFKPMVHKINVKMCTKAVEATMDNVMVVRRDSNLNLWIFTQTLVVNTDEGYDEAKTRESVEQEFSTLGPKLSNSRFFSMGYDGQGHVVVGCSIQLVNEYDTSGFSEKRQKCMFFTQNAILFKRSTPKLQIDYTAATKTKVTSEYVIMEPFQDSWNNNSCPAPQGSPGGGNDQGKGGTSDSGGGGDSCRKEQKIPSAQLPEMTSSPGSDQHNMGDGNHHCTGGDDHKGMSGDRDGNHHGMKRGQPQHRGKDDGHGSQDDPFDCMVNDSYKTDAAKASIKQCLLAYKPTASGGQGQKKTDFNAMKQKMCQAKHQCLQKWAFSATLKRVNYYNS
uniref:Uncharacterized protein n=1 Tax=Romanomermis culicivorax TaxID=13658 RepID=A0A915HIK1_ROMCU